MSTTAVTSWATDITQLGPIYPFVGSEYFLWIAGVVFWIGFHAVQMCCESKKLKEEVKAIKAKKL